MTPRVIVSYDGTDNDRDAIALAALLRDAGADLSLAYVRHLRENDAVRERAVQEEADDMLEGGARALGADVPRHVILDASTGQGLARLAERERADLVAFGSEYRTPAGHVAPGGSAQRLLSGGPVGVALAPAGMRDGRREIQTVGAIAEAGDRGATETAEALARALGAALAERYDTGVDALVVGSHPAGVPHRVTLSAAARYVIETARCPVIVLPRGRRIEFGAAGTA